MADQQDNWWANDAQAPTGEAFLKTLDPARSSQVRALAEGRMELPKGAALRSGPGASLLADVAQYDPTFDTANAPARVATRKAFTSGKQGQNVTSFNTALGHLGTLAQAAEDLHNSGFPIYNRIVNGLGPELGNSDLAARVKAFGVARTAATEELVRAFKGSGPDVHSVQEWEKQINDADSPEAMRRAIGQGAALLGSRIEAARDSYNQGMGTTDQPLPMLSQHASDALKAFQSDDYYTGGYKPIAAGGSSDLPPGSAPLGGAPSGPQGPSPSGPNAGMTISDGTVAADTGPSPLNAQIASMVASGKTGDQIRAFITEQGGNPTEYSNIDANVEYARKHPGYTPAVNVNKPLSGAKSLTAEIAGSAPGAAVISGANTALFGALPKVVAGTDSVLGRLTGDNRSIGEQYGAALSGANYKVDAAREAHPVASLVGDVGGFLAGDRLLAAVPGVSALARATPAALRPAVGDALFGTATGIGSSDSLSDVPGSALKGGALAAGGGVLGRAGARGVAALASPVANAAVQRLTQAGVTLTPGQVLGAGGGFVGRAVKGVEDRLAGFPIVGDIINSTRRGGTEDFNRAAINDALAPVGGSAQGVGHDGIMHARQVVSDAYDTALRGMSAVPDAQFTGEVRQVASNLRGLSQDHRDTFMDIVDRDIQPYVQGQQQMTGDEVQSVYRGLQREISRYSGSNASPQDGVLADRLGELRDAFMGMAQRTDPTASAAFTNANRAHALLSRVENAASKARDGVFTPNQFRQAVTKRGYGTTTSNVAAGNAPMQQLATDASTVLPSSVPDSGTAGREALGLLVGQFAPGAAIGGGVGYQQGGGEGALAGAVLGGSLLSRPGARAFQYVAAGSRGRTLNTLGAALRRNAELGGAVGAPLLLSSISPKGN